MPDCARNDEIALRFAISGCMNLTKPQHGIALMNRPSKSAIKSLVLTLRHRLEEDIAIGLKRYGFAGERWLPLQRLPRAE